MLPVIVVGLGVVLGIWSGIRHAPTLRARQFMIKTALGWFIAACLFFLLICLLFGGINRAIGPDHKRIPERMLVSHFCEGVFWLSMIMCPVAVIASSYSINRRWRRIVEEDLANQDQKTTPANAIRSVYLLGSIALLVFLSVVSSFFILYEGIPMPVYVTHAGILLLGISLFYCAIRISRNQQSFEKYPPLLPNLLSILTGEEKAPRGFRNRISFWGDITGIGLGMYMMQAGLFCFYFRRPSEVEPLELFGVPLGDGFVLSTALVLITYFIYVIVFAGIPRKRYWGMIFTSISVLLIDVCVLFLMFARLQFVEGRIVLEEISIPFQLSMGEFSQVFGFSAWYLFCFTLLGAAGLRAFRKGLPR